MGRRGDLPVKHWFREAEIQIVPGDCHGPLGLAMTEKRSHEAKPVMLCSPGLLVVDLRPYFTILQKSATINF